MTKSAMLKFKHMFANLKEGKRGVLISPNYRIIIEKAPYKEDVLKGPATTVITDEWGNGMHQEVEDE